MLLTHSFMLPDVSGGSSISMLDAVRLCCHMSFIIARQTGRPMDQRVTYTEAFRLATLAGAKGATAALYSC